MNPKNLLTPNLNMLGVNSAGDWINGILIPAVIMWLGQKPICTPSQLVLEKR